MARTHRRGSGAADHGAGRAGHDRHSENRQHPLDFAVRAVGGDAHLRQRHRQQLRAPGSVQPARRSRSSRRGETVGVAAVVAIGTDLSLRAAKLRSLADGAEDVRGLGGRAAIPCRGRRGRRLRFRWRQHAVPGAARSGEDRRGRAHRAAGAGRAGGEQQQRRRRLLLAGRAVLLRARRRPAADAGGHRQRGAGGARRQPGAGQGCRSGGDRHRAAAGPVRFREAGRRGGGRDLAAYRREDPGRAEAGRGEDAGTQPAGPAEGHQGPSVLRPQRPRRGDHPGGQGQPAARHAAGGGGADLLPVRRARRADRRGHHPAVAAGRLHRPGPAGRLGEPVVDRRGGFRHPGRCGGGDGGEHLPPARRSRGNEVQRHRGDPRCGGRGRPTAVLCGGGDRGQLPADLRAVRSVGHAVQADGGHHGVCADRFAGDHPDPVAGAVFVVHAQRRAGAAQPRVRGDQVGLHQGAGFLPGPRVGDDDRVDAAAGPVAAADPADRRGVHAAPGRRRAVGACDHAVHHLVRRVGEDHAADPRHPARVPRSHHGGLGTGPARRRHRLDRLLQRRVLCRPEAVCAVDRRVPDQGRADRGDQQEAADVSRHHLQLHPAGRGRGGRGRDRPEERAGGEGIRLRPQHAAGEGQGDQARAGTGARHP